jgi:L-ectoine synthase
VLIRTLDKVTPVEWGNGLSRRLLVHADGMGYTVTDTLVRAGTCSRLQYVDHLEACYCFSGYGKVVEADGTEHSLAPGVLYALNGHDEHDLIAEAGEDMRLVCVFAPALVGAEVFMESGASASLSGSARLNGASDAR